MELVQKGNQFMKGKSEAFAGFREALAEGMVKAWPEMKADVEGVLQDRNVEHGPRVNGTNA